MVDLLEEERKGWNALSTSKEAATEFYGGLLTEEAIMAFPGGMVLIGKDEILQSIDAQPWDSFDISKIKEIFPSNGTRILVYKAAAQRSGREAYKAVIASTYVLQKGQWKLVMHQQTPE